MLGAGTIIPRIQHLLYIANRAGRLVETNAAIIVKMAPVNEQTRYNTYVRFRLCTR